MVNPQPASVQAPEQAHHQPELAASLLVLSLGALGIVFGDIGTSPLYTLRECLLAAGGAKASTDDLNKVNGDVTGVKNDLESTKGKLDRMTGDMGVMSGLIARNHDDLDELKRKGDRNYYEFSIQKSKSGQHVGPIQITLNKTDQKKSKYTVTVLADDKTIEKKDKTAGEPVQFYVKGTARYAPYEIVVFEVNKNQITGYLATPKSGGAATPTSASNAPAQ